MLWTEDLFEEDVEGESVNVLWADFGFGDIVN